ncbi:hypothetical protein Vi05172_g12763 [Venturia inaequalis]|nr:hypothetical protein Vi05172_g12763 [Venturia inaequalis]
MSLPKRPKKNEEIQPPSHEKDEASGTLRACRCQSDQEKTRKFNHHRTKRMKRVARYEHVAAKATKKEPGNSTTLARKGRSEWHATSMSLPKRPRKNQEIQPPSHEKDDTSGTPASRDRYR